MDGKEMDGKELDTGKHHSKPTKSRSTSRPRVKSSTHVSHPRQTRSGRHLEQPALNPDHTSNPLAIHSSPMQLATRSLSARAHAHSSGQSADSAPRSNRPSSTVPFSRKKIQRSSSTHSRKRAGSSTAIEPLKIPTEKGFNIADHLRNSADNDRLRGSSSSPDIHKLLQDISSVMGSVSPASPSEHSTKDGAGSRDHTLAKPVSAKQNRRAHLRSRVAANFNLPLRSDELEKTAKQGPSITTAAHDSTQGGSKHELSRTGGESACRNSQPSDGAMSTTNGEKQATVVMTGDSNKRPMIPHLDIAGTDHQAAPATNTQERVVENQDGRNEMSARHPPPAVAIMDSVPGKGENMQESGKPIGEQEREQVRSLLERKKMELSRSRVEAWERAHSEVEARERKQLEKEQRRAAKMKADRLAAIEELRKRREERLQLQERLAQEEVRALQASGKTKKQKTKAKRSDKKPEESTVHVDTTPTPEGISNDAAPDKKVDELFEAGNVKPPQTTISHSPPTNHTPSTYDDIMDTLRLLEAVPPPLEPGPLAPPTTTSGRGKQGGSGGLSEGKLQSILSYLDQVERAEMDRSNRLANSVSRSKGSSSILQESPSTGPQTLHINDECELEAAAAAANDVTATILAQRMELDSKTKTVEMLQKALSQQRELTVYHAKEMEREGQKRIEFQKSEYEATIQRHQCFIDQLIDDKKVLSERCEQLVKELKDLDKKYKSKLSSLENTHTAEISKLRQVSAAAEKMRREKWQAEEIQRIKETTVKGLEPEIQRIIAKGKSEIQRLKAVHEAELMQVDERASRRFVAQMEEVREQCAQEKEQACAHERELARQRYEKMAEQEELNYQQQKRRLFAEVAQEKEKLAEQLQRQKTTFDLQLKENVELHDRQLEEQKAVHQQQLEKVRLRHRSEVRQKEEQLEADRGAWQENLVRRQETDMMSKERELRTKLREERDKEIEMVISRLEEETASAKEETERAAEARVRRIREKYEAELKEVERSERSTLEKFNSMKSRVLELEGEVAQLQSGLRLKEQEVDKIGQVASKLTQERDSVSDIVRQEFADRLVSTEEENKELKREMSEVRARHKVELDRLRKAKDKELEEVHGRVKQALEKKEENLNALKEQHDGALKRADHLQMLLQRQRTQLLKK